MKMKDWSVRTKNVVCCSFCIIYNFEPNFFSYVFWIIGMIDYDRLIEMESVL